MTTYGLELAWQLRTVTCPECTTSMRLGAVDLKALRDQLIQARVRIDSLIDGETHVAVEGVRLMHRDGRTHDDETQ